MKQKNPAPPKERVMIYVTPALKADLLALARRNERSMNSTIVLVLRAHIARVKKQQALEAST
jgi:hypothetical protein